MILMGTESTVAKIILTRFEMQMMKTSETDQMRSVMPTISKNSISFLTIKVEDSFLEERKKLTDISLFNSLNSEDLMLEIHTSLKKTTRQFLTEKLTLGLVIDENDLSVTGTKEH